MLRHKGTCIQILQSCIDACQSRAARTCRSGSPRVDYSWSSQAARRPGRGDRPSECKCKYKWGSKVAVAGRHCHLDSLTQKPHLHWDTLSTTSTQETPKLSCLSNLSQRNRPPNTRRLIHPLGLLKTQHGGLRGAQGQLVRGRGPRRRPTQLERLALFAHGQSQAPAGAGCDANWY